MTERGLEPEFSGSVMAQLASITGPGRETASATCDLTGLPWCSTAGKVRARIFSPSAEGMVAAGAAGSKVGDKVRLRLLPTDVERGFIGIALAA